MNRADYTGRTGANLNGEVLTAIKRGAFLSDLKIVRDSFQRIWQEIRVVQPGGCLDPPHGTRGCATDGIQADSSFHQACDVVGVMREKSQQLCSTSVCCSHSRPLFFV